MQLTNLNARGKEERLTQSSGHLIGVPSWSTNSLTNRKTVPPPKQTRPLLLAPRHRPTETICLLLCVYALLSCSAPLPKNGQFTESFAQQQSCQTTQIGYAYHHQPDGHWHERIKVSVATANQILTSSAFAQACQRMKMNKTNGKSALQVCREMACAGVRSLNLGFFNDPNSRYVAKKAGDDIVQFNTAKQNSQAAVAGNIAHELTHVLGYKHFTNRAEFGQRSVPYRVGGLVRKLDTRRQTAALPQQLSY